LLDLRYLNCPAISIPEKITVDLEGLNVGHTIHISSINLPDGCTPTITDRDFTVATIAAPRGGLSENEEGEETESSSEIEEEKKSDS
jgi:large subunit ribosomal protein L25